MAQNISFLDLCLIGAGLYIAKRLVDARRSGPSLPGPSGWPVIGNLLQVPQENKWEYFTALGKTYGDISSVRILGTRYVVLNSFRAISEVLDKQGIKCADRPHLTMACDLAGFEKGMLFDNYNHRVKQYRKYLASLFGSKSSIAAFHPIQEEETYQFLRKILSQGSDKLLDHIRFSATAISLKVAYGYTVQGEQDPLIELADTITSIFSLLAVPGAFLVDLVPALRYLPEWFPGAGFLKDAKVYNKRLIESVVTPHKYVVEQMAAGTAIPSFSSTLLEGGVTPEEEDLIMWTSMIIYLGGADTVIYTIYIFFLAMVLFPDVQTKAQAELDSVVGNERLPSFSDRDSLPYINAVCKEVLRWHLVTPLALPHVAVEDVYYDGFLIPKGSTIIGNAWGILHDESTYPDPGTFRPERFFGDAPQPDPQTVCFGFGRRICPGFHFAEASLFISVAMSLATFKISKDIVNGVEVTPKLDLASGAISHPKPFKCRITPRSAHAEALLSN